MAESLPATLAGLRADIRRRWQALLRALPPPSPLGHPDIVAYLVDEILDRLERELANPPALEVPGPATNFGACPCQMNPLLPCFIAGEQALIESGAPSLGPRLHEVLECYHRLANRELAALCGVCLHRSEATCLARGH